MNAAVAVANLWESLGRFDADQRRFLRACLGRESDPVVPFGGPATTVRAAPWGAAEAPAEGVRVAFAAADGSEHAEALLERGDLLALGIGPWIYRHASEASLRDLLAAMLPGSLERASRLMGADLVLRVQRVRGQPSPSAVDGPWFIAEAVPHLGRLRFRLSRALIEACEAQPMPRRGPVGMRHIPLLWDVRVGCIGIERHDLQGLARGDVLRVLLSPLPQAEVVGGLVPHCDRSAALQPGALPRRRVKLLVGAGGWISLKFEHEAHTEYAMDEQEAPDAPIVPVNLTLPVAQMSLHEIDSVRPGTLVDTGVRLQDVEVALWSAGYRFATGRLVVIGEHLGVEIGRTERDLP